MRHFQSRKRRALTRTDRVGRRRHAGERLPALRCDRVNAIRTQMRVRAYEVPPRLDVAIRRLLEALGW